MRKITVEIKCAGPTKPTSLRFISTSQLQDDGEVQLVIGEETYLFPIEDLLAFARAIGGLKL